MHSGWLINLREQVHETGFFSLINTGFSPEEVQRQYDIGQDYFALPNENKGDPKFRCDFSKGNYFGYRAVSFRPVLVGPLAYTIPHI